MKEGSHKKVQKIRMVHPTCPSKKIQDSKRKDIMNLLDVLFSKCHGMTRKYWGPTTQPTTPNHTPKPNQPLVNQLEVLEPSLRLDLIDSQSSQSYRHNMPNPP